MVLLGCLKHVHSICLAVLYKSASGDLFLGKSLLVHYFAGKNTKLYRHQLFAKSIGGQVNAKR